MVDGGRESDDDGSGLVLDGGFADVSNEKRGSVRRGWWVCRERFH